jgi:hypothetical protein
MRDRQKLSLGGSRVYGALLLVNGPLSAKLG